MLLEKMLHHTAQFLWIGPRLSIIERLALKSFLDLGWQVKLYHYEPILNVPEGVELSDANRIVPKALIFDDNFVDVPGQSYATFADLFRLELLSREGGWWFDADMIAVSRPPSIGEIPDPYFASTWEMSYKTCAINCAMFSQPGDSFIDSLRTQAHDIIAAGSYSFADTGPFLLQRKLREEGMDQNIAPWWEFCPFPWRQIGMSCYGSNRDWLINRVRLAKHLMWQISRDDFKAAYVRRGTRAVHLHNEIWRRSGLSKEGPFHPRSFVGQSLRRHNVCS